MFTFIFATCIVVSSSLAAVPRSSNLRPHLDGRVVGGQPADIADFPYQLSFEYDGRHVCGASIIGENWVVTAAHCVDGSSPSSIQFRAGSSTRGSGGTLHPASEIIVNPKFDYYTIDYDIAVVKVSTPFKFGKGVQPITLTSVEPSTGDIATVSGWGTLSPGGPVPTQLQVVSVPVSDRKDCNKVYGVYGGITENMFCASEAEGGKDSCQGDSGGPLVVGGKLAGIVSWGVGCADKGYPGVYSNVANLKRFVTETAGVN